MEPRLKLVAPVLLPPDEDAFRRSLVIWGEDNEGLRQKWLAAVQYLRHVSRKGWIIDKRISKKADNQLM